MVTIHTDETTPPGTLARPPESGIDLQRLFFSHKLILILMIALGLAGGYVVFNRAVPEYASSAQVLVVKNEVPLPVDGVRREPTSSPVDTHIELIRTPVILTKAVADGNLQDLPSLMGSSSPAALIASGLSVRRSDQSDEMLILTYRGTHSEDCQRILNAVVSAYIGFVKESQAELNKSTVSLINQATEELDTSLKEKVQRYQEFRKTSGLVGSNEEPLNIHTSRLTELEAQRMQLRVESKMLMAESETIEQALESGVSPDAILLMAMGAQPADRMIESELDSEQPSTEETPTAETLVDPIPESITPKLIPLLVEEQKLLETHGRRHPKVLSLQKEIRLTRSLLEQEAAERRRAALKHQAEMARVESERAKREAQSTSESDSDPDVIQADLLATYIDALGQRIQLNERKMAQIDAEYEDEQRESQKLALDENRHFEFQEDISRTKRLFDLLLEELQEINLVKDGGFLAVEMVTPPGAGRQVAPVLTDNLVMGGFLGLLSGLAISLLLELSDRSFRGPEQVMNQLGLPVVGHIPTIVGRRQLVEGSNLDKSLVAFHRPKSRLAESYRAVRVPILFGAKHQGVKVLQVTSPDPGDGKSTLAANLAIVMANSGKKCLLIDADFRRPKVHKLFGVPNGTGFSSVIAGKTELADSIITSEVENLDLLTTGPKVKNPAELILSAEFESTLQVVREKYDFIILDTPPALAVTDPAAVASKVDAVLLVLRITKRVQLHAARSRETLQMVGANILGVVVNGIGESTGYAYGTGVYSSKSSKYQYSSSPYYGSYYGGYARYGDYYLEKDNEVDSEGVRKANIKTKIAPK